MNELQRSVVMDWDVNSVEQLLDQLNKYDPAETKVENLPKDPLFYLLGRLIQHQRDTKTSKSDTLYISLEITSIVGRGHKLVLNDVDKTTDDEPILVLHMGKERAMNIIPKKLNLAMLDVFDVQLGNFSIISISQKTKESMHISLPKEKALEEDDLDLHILVKPKLKSASEEKHDSNENADNSAPSLRLEDTDNAVEERSTSEGPDQDATLDQQSIVEERITSKEHDATLGQNSVAEDRTTSEKPDANLDQRNAAEEHSTSEGPDHDATLDQNSVAEDRTTSEEPDANLDQPNAAEEHSTNEGPDHDATLDQNSVVKEDSVIENPDVTLDHLNAAEEQSTSEGPDHDASLDQNSVAEDRTTSEEPDAYLDQRNAAEEQSTSKGPDHDATLDKSSVVEEPGVVTDQRNHDEKQNTNKGHDVTINQQNDRQEQKTQAQWDLYDLPIFLRKETYQAIIAKQNKSNTIKKWLKYCNLKSLNNNVKNKEALQSHLLKYETGCSRAPPSIISGLIEKLIGPGIEEELKHCNVNYDPSKHNSVASKKLLLRITLTERQDGFHSRPKGSPIKKKSADSRGEVEAQPPSLLNDSSDSSSEEDEDTWDDSNSNTEKILQFLKKNSPKTSCKSKKETKSKLNSEETKQKASDPRSKHDKEPLYSQNHVNMENSVKVLEKGIIKLQSEMKTQQTNLDFLAKELMDVKKYRSNEEANSLKKLIDGKNKVLLETLNIQQTNLDNITDSLSKNDKAVSKLRNKVESSINSYQRTHEEHKNNLAELSNSLSANSETINELRKRVDATENKLSVRLSKCETADPKHELENLSCQIEQLNTKLDMVTTKLVQTSSVQSPQIQTQIPMLLAMVFALWKENQELKGNAGNDPPRMTSSEGTPIHVVKKAHEAVEPAEFLILEDEIETKSKVETKDKRNAKVSSGKKPAVSWEPHIKQTTMPPRTNEDTSRKQAATNQETVSKQKLASPETSNENSSTGVRKVLLKTPIEHQLRFLQEDVIGEKTNSDQTKETVKASELEHIKIKPQGPDKPAGSNARQKQKTTRIIKPKNDVKYTMTQGMKSRVTENNTPEHDVSQSVSSKEQTNSSRESAAEGLPLSHKQRENMEDSSALNISRYRTHKCMIVHDPFLKDFDSGKFSKWFDVTNTVQFYSLNDILSKGTLVSKIKALSPEIIYLHVGFGDLINKTKGDTIVDMYKQLIYKLLETSEVKICMSLMIPVLGYPETNSKLKQINRCVSDFISQVRNQPKYRNRIFTSNNDVIGGFINRAVGSKGATVNLSEQGQKKMWIKIKDCLQRSLGITPLRQHRKRESTSNNARYE